MDRNKLGDPAREVKDQGQASGTIDTLEMDPPIMIQMEMTVKGGKWSHGMPQGT